MLRLPGLARLKSFRHGVHPDDFKGLTRDHALERVPIPDLVILPLSQHLGRPSRPVVRPGEYVHRGQLIAEATGFVSANLHASVSGTVSSIAPHNHASGAMVDAIAIETDRHSPQTLYHQERTAWKTMDAPVIIDRIKDGGFVGLGGAAFPTHVKLSVPEGKKARFFIVNAAECEPYLNSDYRILLEQTASIFSGTAICLRALGADKAIIGIESNKPEAVERLRTMLPAGLPCEVIALETKYPQGAEKMLIEAVFHREVPSGKLPIDVEVVVNNVGTVAAIGDFFSFGQPLIERVVTITGPGIERPSNLIIPIGTRLTDVIAFCGGIKDSTRQILFGGPMMGAAQRFLDVPIMKGTSGVLFLTDEEVLPRHEYACIKCQRCVDACPVYLNPSRLGALAKTRLYEDMLEYHVMDCIECGSCSYVCPSNIPLVQRFRVAKGLLREKKAREEKKVSA